MAKRIKALRNIKPNDVEPFSLAEVGRIIDACSVIGRTPYERLRAKAMLLTLRYTALRIGDVAMLARDRISRDGNRWRIFLRTEKSGKPVFLPLPGEMKAALDALPVPRNSSKMPNGFVEWHHIRAVHEGHRGANFGGGLQEIRRRRCAHPHRFRHTLATELLGRGTSFEDVADILGNSPDIVRKYYGKWSSARQARIDDLMEKVHAGTEWTIPQNPPLFIDLGTIWAQTKMAALSY